MIQNKEQSANSVATNELPLEENVNRLAKYGGFDLLETAIEGVQNMNPERKARKKIFFTENSKKEEREQLKRTLEIWSEAINNSNDLNEMIDSSKEKATETAQTLKKNLGVVIDQTRDLEKSYRSTALFYKNSEQDKIKNISIMNAAPDQIKDLDNTRFIDAVSSEIKNTYDRLDLSENYGLLVLPGYLGSNSLIEKWGKIAYDNKVMMVTDFEHLDEADDVMEMFSSANLAGGDMFRSNVMMTCNWLVGRGKFDEVNEEDDLYVPPAGALAGKVYQTLMSQVTAGKKFGGINEVQGVKFDLRKSEISSLEKMGLIPMVNEYGKVMAFSAKTLFNGSNLGLQTYSVVRVFDYVTKVMMDFLNRRAFENFNARTRKELLKEIIQFLDTISGPDKLIENFTIKRFEQDPIQKDRVHLDIHMKPYFPAKNFLIKMEGQKGDDGNEWDSEYAQD